MSLGKPKYIYFLYNDIIAWASYGRKPAIVVFKYSVQYVFQVVIA